MLANRVDNNYNEISHKIIIQIIYSILISHFVKKKLNMKKSLLKAYNYKSINNITSSLNADIQ